MSRLDRAAIVEALVSRLDASPDPEGLADLVSRQGHICVAATAAEIKPAIERLKAIPGYRWLAINGGDLFVANPMTIGSKARILDPTGKVLKQADLPRAK